MIVFVVELIVTQVAEDVVDLEPLLVAPLLKGSATGSCDWSTMYD